jgi:hypothetical protein
MRRNAIAVGLLIAACWGLAAAEPAHARRVSASAGRQTNGLSRMCYSFGLVPGFVGVSRIQDDTFECLQQHFVLPIMFDNPSDPGVQRTVRLFGKRGSNNGSLGCSVQIWKDGQIVSSNSGTITTNGYSSVDVVIDNVPAGSSGYVACGMSMGSAQFLGIEYTP